MNFIFIGIEMGHGDRSKLFGSLKPREWFGGRRSCVLFRNRCANSASGIGYANELVQHFYISSLFSVGFYFSKVDHSDSLCYKVPILFSNKLITGRYIKVKEEPDELGQFLLDALLGLV